MKNYYLWLPSWYPNSLSPYDGDFIQRHAKAASIHNTIVVLYVKKDASGLMTTKTKRVVNEQENITEIIIYYKAPKTGFTFVDKAISFFRFNNLYFKSLRNIVRQLGKPILLHVHVLVDVALPAVWFSWKYKIPFIISEHWGGFLSSNQMAFDDLFYLKKYFIRLGFRKSKAVVAVSNQLGNSIKHRFGIPSYKTIPNVVDTAIFYPSKKSDNRIPTFIHVSNGTDQKNVLLIIEALGIIKKEGISFLLQLVIPNHEKYTECLAQHNIVDCVELLKEAPQDNIAEYMRNADALLLYSNYETFGCVVIEANACGIPAILSRLDVFAEYSIENETVLYAERKSPQQLAQTIIQFIKYKNIFHKTNISHRTHRLFSFSAISKQFDDLYHDTTIAS